MNVITITREYGAGGAELARELAHALSWELLDRELLHQAAQIQHVPDAELERLDEQAIAMADRFRLHTPHQKYLEGLRQAAQQAANRGRVILVGRGARHLLGERPDCLHVRLVAPRAWRAARMARLESCSPEVALARCHEMDRTRRQFARYFFGDIAAQPAQYDLVVNTGRVPLEDVVAVVSTFVATPATDAVASTPSQRVLTLSREFGAGDQGFAPPLAERLGLHVCDREMLEQQAIRLGVPEAALERIDEQVAGVFERLRPGGLSQRYFQALGQLTREMAARGDVLLVGRGGCWFLRDHPTAFHVRLIATMATRLRRVMEYRWVRENVAQKLIAQSDEQRRAFGQNYFGANGCDPLEYHVTVNSGRLGPLAVDLVALAAQRHWTTKSAVPA
jgi:cytidylate kinase